MRSGGSGARRADGSSAPRAGRERILGIETSCDETAAAVVTAGREVESSVVASQVDLHARFGGVVPEIAGREHLVALDGVIAEALERAGIDSRGRFMDDPAIPRTPAPAGSPTVDPGPPRTPEAGLPRTPEAGLPRAIDAVAATVGPGLVGCLLVGVSEAKSLAMAWGLPFVGVNHLEAHLYAALLDAPELEFPLVVLLVSGGHTLLALMRSPGDYTLLGQTLDDAAGEAFDKVARYLGLGYPGGPAIDRVARNGDPRAIAFPRALMDGGYDFSFSGLKTSVVRYVEAHPGASNADVAASFQQAVVDVAVEKARKAAAASGARGICLAGGVAANTLLRSGMEAACAEDGLSCLLPSREMCTDNAAMVASAAWWRLREHGPDSLDSGAMPSLAFPA